MIQPEDHLVLHDFLEELGLSPSQVSDVEDYLRFSLPREMVIKQNLRETQKTYRAGYNKCRAEVLSMFRSYVR